MTNPIIENLRGISAIIPCKSCAAHYDAFFQTEIDKREQFVDFHNTVNQKLGKPIISHDNA